MFSTPTCSTSFVDSAALISLKTRAISEAASVIRDSIDLGLNSNLGFGKGLTLDERLSASLYALNVYFRSN